MFRYRCVWAGIRSQSRVPFSGTVTLIFFRCHLSLSWNLPYQIGWLSSQLSFFLCLLSTEITGAHYQLSHPTFYVGAEDQLGTHICMAIILPTELSPYLLYFSLLCFHLVTIYYLSVSFCLPPSQTFTIAYSSMAFSLLIALIFEMYSVFLFQKKPQTFQI